jgi:dihydrofolate reductase
VARLFYTALASLDGYIEDANGKFGWAEPDEEVHRFVNDLERPIGTYLYGRRMYEVMGDWETPDPSIEETPYRQDFASIWRAADKIVYSKTLREAPTDKTRIERDFDRGAVRRLKERSEADLSVSGPGLAAHAFAAGLVDECRLFLVPVIVGGGKRALPADVRLALELLDERSFDNGTVHLHYRVKG